MTPRPILRAFATVAALAVALVGLLPLHVHAADGHQIVHRHVIAGAGEHHDDDADHHDGNIDPADHVTARLLTFSFTTASPFVAIAPAIVATTELVSPVTSLKRLPAGRRRLPTHDPPLSFVSSPAPPPVA